VSSDLNFIFNRKHRKTKREGDQKKTKG